MDAPPSFALGSLLVAVGGGAGAWLRYVASLALAPAARAGAAFPWATFSVNVAGSMAMGLLVGWLARQGTGSADGAHWRLLLGTGVLGGFTTFSTFSLECVTLIERGAPGIAATYMALSLVAGLGSLFAALLLTRALA